MPPPATNRNVELKARLADLDRARQTAFDLDAEPGGIEFQRDTYFPVPHGRLKLREIEGKQAVLISYSRPDTFETRRSDYTLVPVPDPDLLKQALTAALGVQGVVEKRREIFFYLNVRIHLDQVAGHGTFLEFEAVLRPGQPEDEGHALLRELRHRFGINGRDLLDTSYGEMIA